MNELATAGEKNFLIVAAKEKLACQRTPLLCDIFVS